MSFSSELLFLTDTQGNCVAVQIPYALWERLEKYVPGMPPYLPTLSGQSPPSQEPLEDFNELMQFWDFRYPYNPAVNCPNCGSSVQDWRDDTAQGRPFRLKNANIGGLLVFQCQNCLATIRHKNFRDHVAVEFTPPRQK